MSTINPVQPFVIESPAAPEHDGASTPLSDYAFSMIGDDPTSNTEERDRFVKSLFQGEPTCQCCIKWLDEPPEDAGSDNEDSDDEEGDTPLLVRRRRTFGGSKAWEVHCIEIKNAALRTVLLKVFENYQFLKDSLKYLTFFAPFRPFYHVWDKFEATIDQEKDEMVLKSLQILRQFVKRSLGSETRLSKELTASGVISYSCLWTLYKPGDLLYTNVNGVDAFVRLQSITNNTQLVTKYIDWDGRRFGWVDQVITLSFFIGTQEITKLEAYPAHMHPNYEALKELLVQRGQKFRELAGIHTKMYVPKEELAHPDSSKQKVARRIIVDPSSHPDQQVQISCNLWSPVPQLTFLIQQQPFRSSNCMPGAQHVPLDVNNRRKQQPLLANPEAIAPAYRHPKGHAWPPPPPQIGPMGMDPIDVYGVSKKKGSKSRPMLLPIEPPMLKCDDENAELTPDELMMCNFEVRGFCLRDRRWRRFDVDRIRDVEWNEEPFDNLVLPDGYKDLILAFVESQIKQNDRFDDVINGKGGGLVILLCGAPGVGKTLTAESVAEKIKAPLYKMELLEEGEDAAETSDSSYEYQARRTRRKKRPSKLSIEDQFEHATNWDAVLLFDECDAHLGRRSSSDAQQKLILNKFLQKLEYFPSLLFLTTNHAESLDPAIASRVHLTINYPELNVESRLTIWRNFLDRAHPPAALAWDEIELLARLPLNGRRIKNVVKTAQIMAKRERRAVRLDDIKKVMKITEGLRVE